MTISSLLPLPILPTPFCVPAFSYLSLCPALPPTLRLCLQEELSAGLRVEFAVPSEALGMVIGKGGRNIERVKTETGVDRIVVDDEVDPPMVRIRGGDAESVAEARRQLEFDVRTIGLSREQAQWLATKPGTLVSPLINRLLHARGTASA